MIKLTEINIYPIKSTRRIALREGTVLKRGLSRDRRWMLVDDEGVFVTARQHPRLAVVATRINAETLVANAPGMPELVVPLQPPANPSRQVRIWRDGCTAVDCGAPYHRWFSQYLGISCHLVRMRSSDVRPVNPDYGRAGDEVSFADGFPLLLISEASLADLNSRLDKPVSMRRFRPNVVVAGCDPYAEDDWARIRIGALVFEVAKACSRCVFTTIDPDTGEKDPQLEPLRTLSSYRKRAAGGVFFGQNLIPRDAGTIHLEDPIEILA